MTWFMVTWLAWSCPGGWFSGLVPAPARPLLCQPRTEHQVYTRPQEAYSQIERLGPGSASTMTEYHGLRRKDHRIIWASYVQIEK